MQWIYVAVVRFNSLEDSMTTGLSFDAKSSMDIQTHEDERNDG